MFNLSLKDLLLLSKSFVLFMEEDVVDVIAFLYLLERGDPELGLLIFDWLDFFDEVLEDAVHLV